MIKITNFEESVQTKDAHIFIFFPISEDDVEQGGGLRDKSLVGHHLVLEGVDHSERVVFI